MRFLKTILLLLTCGLVLFSFTKAHEYYVSLTQIEHVPEKESVQIISRLFVDDFENALRARYNEKITFGGPHETANIDQYIERYLKDKLIIKINGQKVDFSYLGNENDIDIVKCYIEIEGIKSIDTFEITNKLLFDFTEQQQNIVKTKINSRQKSVILIPQEDTAVLKFN